MNRAIPFTTRVPPADGGFAGMWSERLNENIGFTTSYTPPKQGNTPVYESAHLFNNTNYSLGRLAAFHNKLEARTFGDGFLFTGPQTRESMIARLSSIGLGPDYALRVVDSTKSFQEALVEKHKDPDFRYYSYGPYSLTREGIKHKILPLWMHYKTASQSDVLGEKLPVMAQISQLVEGCYSMYDALFAPVNRSTTAMRDAMSFISTYGSAVECNLFNIDSVKGKTALHSLMKQLMTQEGISPSVASVLAPTCASIYILRFGLSSLTRFLWSVSVDSGSLAYAKEAQRINAAYKELRKKMKNEVVGRTIANLLGINVDAISARIDRRMGVILGPPIDRSRDYPNGVRQLYHPFVWELPLRAVAQMGMIADMKMFQKVNDFMLRLTYPAPLGSIPSNFLVMDHNVVGEVDDKKWVTSSLIMGTHVKVLDKGKGVHDSIPCSLKDGRIIKGLESHLHGTSWDIFKDPPVKIIWVKENLTSHFPKGDYLGGPS